MSRFSKLLILPKNENSVLAEVDGMVLNIIKDFPIKAFSKWAIADSGLVAFIAAKGRRISFIRINDDLKILDQFSLLLPPKYRAKALAFKNDILYTGGHYSTEIFGYIDCSRKPVFWQGVCVPPEILKKGKAIDDILIDGDRLIAVDDFIFPKFLLTYNISDPGKPQFQEMHKLENNGTYEHIYKAVMNRKYIALLSSTVGRNGSARHINILDRSSFEPKAVLNSFQDIYKTIREKDDELFFDIAFAGDRLVVASENAGVTIVDFADGGKGYEKKIFYPENLLKGSVVCVHRVDGQRNVVCVSQAGKDFGYCVLEL